MPQIRLRDVSNTLRSVTRIRVRDENNDLRDINRISARDVTNTLRVVWQTFTATASPETVTGFSNTGAPANIATGSTIAAPIGGTSPFTYAWALYGSSPYAWTIGSPAAATTNFTVTALPAGVTTNALFKGVITDATGATAEVFVEAIANNGQPYEPPNRYLRDDLRSNL